MLLTGLFSIGCTVQLALASGQFHKVNPGAGRLLGVLSLQSLPRRLTLDFRDVFAEGFTRIVAAEDYATGETTQTALSSGLQDKLLFGRNEPPLHHYHRTFRRELGLEPPPVR